MLDTVRLGFQVLLPAKFLDTCFRVKIRTPLDAPFTGEERCVYHRKFLTDDGKSFYLVYYPQNRKGEPDPLVLLEFSLPRIVNGTNIFMVEDLNEALDVTNRTVNSVLDMKEIDLHEGVVYRADLVYNHQVGEDLPFYLKAFANLSYPHHTTIGYETGVLYKADMGSTKFYGKEWECKDPRAHGFWRQERTLRNAQVIREATGKRYPTLLDFTPPLIEKLLTEDFERLNVKEQLICDEVAALQLLSDKYDAKKADRLLGFMVRIQGLTKDQVKGTYGKTLRTVNRNLKEIADAGVSMALIENKRTLPKLVVKFGTEMSQNPSVTSGLEGNRDVQDVELPPEENLLENWINNSEVDESQPGDGKNPDQHPIEIEGEDQDQSGSDLSQ